MHSLPENLAAVDLEQMSAAAVEGKRNCLSAVMVAETPAVAVAVEEIGFELDLSGSEEPELGSVGWNRR